MGEELVSQKNILPRVPGASPFPKYLLAIFTSIFLLLVSAYGGYWYGSQTASEEKSPSNQEEATSQPQEVSVSPTHDTNPTARWKIYKDEKNGIEFRYPSNWYAQRLPEWTFDVYLENHPFEIPKETEFMTSIQIGLNEARKMSTGERYFREKTLAEGIKNIKALYDPETVKVNNLTVGGKKAVQISGVLGPGMFEGRYFIQTFIQMNDCLLEVSLTKREFKDIYDQILQTFQFFN